MGVRVWLREYDAEGVALMLVPIPLVPLYVYFSDALPNWRLLADLAAVAVAVEIGLAGVWLLPTSRLIRAGVSVAYAAALVFLSALWAIAYRGGL